MIKIFITSAFLKVICLQARFVLAQEPFNNGARMDPAYSKEIEPHAFPFLGVAQYYKDNQWMFYRSNIIIISEHVVMGVGIGKTKGHIRIIAGVNDASVVEASQQIREVCHAELIYGSESQPTLYYSIIYLSEPLIFNQFVSPISINEGVPPGEPIPGRTPCTIVSFCDDFANKPIREEHPTKARMVSLILGYRDDLAIVKEHALFTLLLELGAALLCPYEDRVILFGVGAGISNPPGFFIVPNMDKSVIAAAINKGKETCGGGRYFGGY